MSIDALIKAAEFLDRREREAEHGYASTVPLVESAEQLNKRHMKGRRGMISRSTHNELEKNRRAHLRVCLERLRDQVPPGPDASRHTTLGLLTRARDYIRSLEDRDRMNHRYKEQLRRQQRQLSMQVQLVSRRKHQRASNSVSSSGYSTSESAESVDSPESPDSDESESNGAGRLGKTRFSFKELDIRVAETGCPVVPA